MSTVEKAAQLLRSRLEEIDYERRQLEQALSGLTERGSAPKNRPSKSRRGSSRASNGSSRAPRGQRRQQVLDYLKENSGAGPADAARALDMSANQVSAVIRRLREEKLVRKSRGGGYRLSANTKNG